MPEIIIHRNHDSAEGQGEKPVSSLAEAARRISKYSQENGKGAKIIVGSSMEQKSDLILVLQNAIVDERTIQFGNLSIDKKAFRQLLGDPNATISSASEGQASDAAEEDKPDHIFTISVPRGVSTEAIVERIVSGSGIQCEPVVVSTIAGSLHRKMGKGERDCVKLPCREKQPGTIIIATNPPSPAINIGDMWAAIYQQAGWSMDETAGEEDQPMSTGKPGESVA